MEMQIIINGTFSEMQEVLRSLSGGHQVQAILESFEPVHHPHDVEVPAREIMLTPMGPMPIVQVTAQPEPVMDPLPEPVPIDGRIEYKHCMTCGTQYVPVPKQIKPFCSKSCYMKDWYDRHNQKPVVDQPTPIELPSEAIQAEIEPTPEVSQKHCHQCGALFTPKHGDSNFCSKRCYMIEWREVRKNKAVKDAAPDAKNVAPDAIKTAPDAIPPVAILLSDEKAEKIRKVKKFLPERHYIQKDNFGGMY
jgi:endogenous inhibitor of DNA gyrase (YacG/DUF329 family)